MAGKVAAVQSPSAATVAPGKCGDQILAITV
jgi:hypothetical protein